MALTLERSHFGFGRGASGKLLDKLLDSCAVQLVTCHAGYMLCIDPQVFFE